MNQTTIGILLCGSAQSPRDAFTEDKYRLLAEQMAAQAWEVRTLTYHDSRRDALRSTARQCDALLAWINPIEPELDRAALDTFLRDLADSGVLVSAHPDAILKIGTKDVLVDSQPVGWSVDACAYRSLAEFEERAPTRIRRDGPRVLKQYRGNGGQGVWKVSALPHGEFEVLSAARGACPETFTAAALADYFQSQVFARGSHLVDQPWVTTMRRRTTLGRCSPAHHLVDQPWVTTMRRGMVRAYLCGSKVGGFGYQEINALYPVAPEDDFTRRAPSRRHYYTQDCFLFQPLRRRLEDEWIPALLRQFQIPPDDLPLIWDADFFLGDAPGKEFLLCEINASCVSPFPESAVTPLIAELRRRLANRRAIRAGRPPTVA